MVCTSLVIVSKNQHNALIEWKEDNHNRNKMYSNREVPEITVPRGIIKSSHICTDIWMAGTETTTKIKEDKNTQGDSDVTDVLISELAFRNGDQLLGKLQITKNNLPSS